VTLFSMPAYSKLFNGSVDFEPAQLP
jgi:hypothetical protein